MHAPHSMVASSARQISTSLHAPHSIICSANQREGCHRDHGRLGRRSTTGRRGSLVLCHGRGRSVPLGNDLIDQSKLEGLLRRHERVALCRPAHVARLVTHRIGLGTRVTGTASTDAAWQQACGRRAHLLGAVEHLCRLPRVLGI